MKRRDLLRAAGAATIVDFDALAGKDGPDAVLSGDAGARILDRLPPLVATPGDGAYDVTITREVDEEALLDPGLLGDADLHAALVAPLATASVGVGASAGGEVGESLAARGYREVGTVSDRSLYARRSRHRATVVVPGPEDVVVVNGRDRAAAASFARASVSSAASLAGTHTAIATALDLLGEGDVVTIRPADSLASDGEEPADGTGDAEQRPLVTASRIAVGTASGAVRDAAVYATAAESSAALDGPGPWPDPAVRPTTVTREGETLLRDQAVEVSALPLDP